MKSRLSSLLVRDGVVAVRRMEKAFQRQVLFGGALDTILLEMNAVSEQRLLQYLSLATGFPPATARELESLEPSAAERCPRELAERFEVVPLSFEGEALRVLTCDPVDLGALEALASELRIPVQPFIAPEFRFEIAFDRVFGGVSGERFTRLAEASRLSAIPPAERGPAVVVEAAGAATGSARPPQPAQAPAAVEAAGEVAIEAAGSVGAAPAAALASAAMADSDASMRQALEMTTEAVHDRREQTERLEVDAYRRYADQDTEPVVMPAEEPVRAGEADVSVAPEGAGEVVRADEDDLSGVLPGAGEVIRADEDDLSGVLPGAGEVIRADETEVSIVPEGAGELVGATGPDVSGLPPGAGEVVIEYDTPLSGPIEEARPVRGSGEDVRADAVLGPDITPTEPSVPSVIAAPAVPLDPIRISDSAPTPAPFRRVAGFDPAPLSVAQARALLAPAAHRDLVFEILLRAIRSRTWYVALLTVQGGTATGRIAIVGDEVDQSDVLQVLIPLDLPSAFRQAVSTASPYIGPVATGDSRIDSMIRHMGGVIPPSALLLPIVLRNRVVALVVGHRGGDMVRIAELAEFLPLAAGAGEALGRIIMHGKAHRQKAATAPAEPDAAGAGGHHNTSDPVAVQVAAPPMVAATPSAGGGGPAPLTFTTEVEALVVALESANEEARAMAMGDALARPGDVLPWLRLHFPGRLEVGRAQLGGRHLRAAQHGPLLDLVVRMGAAASEVVSEKLRDRESDVRYYAALCAAEMKLESLLPALVQRLFDSEQQTRDLAIEALSAHPMHELEAALELPRRLLQGEDLARIEAAAAALAGLGDVHAIPDLLDLHARGGAAAHVATSALVVLTKQDFGHNNRKWRQWWDKHRRQSRIEWLLEGLAHKETHIRRSAVEDLRKVTGEYFGYHHDLPRREREQARQRWLNWWNQIGRQRYPPRDERENDRTVEIVPPRRT